MTQLVTRAQWGARPRKSGTTSIVSRPSITLHWEGGGWGWPWDHSTCDDKVRSMQAFHMNNRGWSDIAYNYLACPHDYLFEGRGFERRSSANGSDAANYASFAIQAMWGVAANAEVPNNLLRALIFGIEYLQDHGNATAVIKGHRDWKQTDCPGDEIYTWIKDGCPSPDPTTPVFEDGEMLSNEALRQMAATMVAVLDQEVKDGQSLHELVQRFSAFNAENTRQNVDQAERAVAGVDEQVELVLKDDFATLATKVNQLQDNVSSMQSTLTSILNKLNNPPA